MSLHLYFGQNALGGSTHLDQRSAQ